ncbi:hypothetical protein FRAHR75_130074 [Frankia sp. Hr75.2]|nr:hypothetical protein FRAHR75_130074 [Frankia sp. Hr75.2]
MYPRAPHGAAPALRMRSRRDPRRRNRPRPARATSAAADASTVGDSGRHLHQPAHI